MQRKKRLIYLALGLVVLLGLISLGTQVLPPEYVPTGWRKLFKFMAHAPGLPGTANNQVSLTAELPSYSVEIWNESKLQELLQELGMWNRYLSVREIGDAVRTAEGVRVKRLAIEVMEGVGSLDGAFISKDYEQPVRSVDYRVTPEGEVTLRLYLNLKQMEVFGLKPEGAVSEGLIRGLLLVNTNGTFEEDFEDRVRDYVNDYGSGADQIFLVKRAASWRNFGQWLVKRLAPPVSAQSCWGNITCGTLNTIHTCGTDDPFGRPCLSDLDCAGTGYSCTAHNYCTTDRMVDCQTYGFSATCLDAANVCNNFRAGACVGYADNNGNLKTCNYSAVPAVNCHVNVKKVIYDASSDNAPAVWREMPSNDGRVNWPVSFGGAQVGNYPQYGSQFTVQWVPPLASWPWNTVNQQVLPSCNDARLSYCFEGPNSPVPCTDVRVRLSGGSLDNYRGSVTANNPTALAPGSNQLNNWQIPNNGGTCEANVIVHWFPCTARPDACEGAGGYLTSPRGPQLLPNGHQVPTQIINVANPGGLPDDPNGFDFNDYIRVNIRATEPADDFYFLLYNDDNQNPCNPSMPGYPNCDVPKAVCVDTSQFQPQLSMIDSNLNDGNPGPHRELVFIDAADCPAGSRALRYYDPYRASLGPRREGTMVLAYDDVYIQDRSVGMESRPLLLNVQLGGYVQLPSRPVSYPVARCSVEFFSRPYCQARPLVASSVYEGGSFELKAKLVDYWNRLIVDNRFSTLFDPQHDGVFSPATGVLDNTPVLGASQTYEPPIAEFAPYGQDNLGEYSALFTAVGSAGQSDNIAVSANLVTRQVNLNDVCLRVNQSITIPQPSLISGNVYLGAGSGAVCNGMGVPVQPGAGSVVEFSSLARTVTTTVNADGSYAFAEPQLLDQGADLRLVIADTSQYGCNCPGGCRYHLQVMTNGAAIVRDYYLMRPYWWQTRGGDVGANQAGGGVSVTSALPTGEALSLVSGVIMDSGILLNRSLADPSLGAGFFSEGYPSQLFNWVAHSAYETGPTNQRREDFELFRELLNIPVTPWVSDDFSGTGNKPLGVSATARIPGVFVYEGELIIGDWGGSDDVAANQAYIILVNGDVLIEAPRLTVAPRGFLMIIASGNIIISGEALMAQGIYVADESLNFEADPSLRPFNGEGVFVGWSGVSFGRSLTNNANPAELMTYRPDFLLYAPDDLRYPVFNWKQELPQKVDEAVFESWPGP